jgi:NitT/TauT family transport system ATP-binding protein
VTEGGAERKLRIEKVTLRFMPRKGNAVTALESISLDVENKEFSVIVGPSGCGKSSLLRLIAGLIRPSYSTGSRCARMSSSD